MESDEKACPFCGETIKAIAIKCKHCQSLMNQGSNSSFTKTSETIVQSTSGVIVTGSKIIGTLLIIFGILLSMSVIGALIGIPMIVAGVIFFFSPTLAIVIGVICYLLASPYSKNSSQSTEQSHPKVSQAQ